MSVQESLQVNIVKTITLFVQWPGFSIAGRLEVTVVQIDTVNALQFALNEKSMQRGLYWKQGHLRPATCIYRPSNCALSCNGPIILWNGSWWWLSHYQCNQVLHIQTCNCSLKTWEEEEEEEEEDLVAVNLLGGGVVILKFGNCKLTN